MRALHAKEQERYKQMYRVEVVQRVPSSTTVSMAELAAAPLPPTPEAQNGAGVNGHSWHASEPRSSPGHGAAAVTATAAQQHGKAPAAAELGGMVWEDDVSEGEGDERGLSDEMLEKYYPNTPPPEVCVVNTIDEAHAVAAQLMQTAMMGRTFACDTEVMDIAVR